MSYSIWKTDRRQFLSLLAPLALSGLPRTSRAAQFVDHGIKPIDLSSGLTFLTPNDAFFVRDHFGVPRISLDRWTFEVAGRVSTPFRIDYSELSQLPARNLTATMECAGNAVGYGGVSTTTWRGVSLAIVLKRAGISSRIKHIRFVGADRGAEGGPDVALAFARSIPIEKAIDPDTLLAFQMDDAPLPPDHGYPVRAIVPGWYGMDSVKWLSRVEALEREDAGFFMTRRYRSVRLETIGSTEVPVTHMLVKSQITQPREGEIVGAGPYIIRGAAWAGENRVVRVEVSIDSGKTWLVATLENEPRPYTWVLWRYKWNARPSDTYRIILT
jgi:DMSO/TMAO reductase YedYZ molybdopterin-dependent catalytic subunit